MPAGRRERSSGRTARRRPRGVAEPNRLLDLNRLKESGLRQIRVTDDGIRFGALVRMGEAADHREVEERYPVIADSLRLAASG
ncbi:hypothetical protein EN787_34240, partial [Mesorhizobium sp. M1C.F.Ca.ET.144.01.1.1]|uniref:FAD binding domain-containing protein n=1 Tax=Mesorhizobium sp. M1C.F.Ca.ET.144.01.1.1 TaxID=2563921 RepID=UPI00113BE340